MLDALAVPPRLIIRALDDLHTVARHLPALTAAAEVLPRTEDELSANIALLRVDVQGLREDVQALNAALKKLPGI